jgi:three-Cys-motif partner protein
MSSSKGDPRTWHAWSRWKDSNLLGVYLKEFTKACKKAPHVSFLDCFAGTATSQDHQGDTFTSSPRIALQTNPEFTDLVFFELPENAIELESALRTEYPSRSFTVLGGDCNATIRDGLSWLRDRGTRISGPQLGPAIAFLDPDEVQLAWSTVEAIARWDGRRDAGDFVRKGKTEQLILFPTGPLRRRLPVQAGSHEASEKIRAEVDDLFGNSDWRSIYDAQRAGRISGEDSWMHYVEQYRLGLTQLGYDYTSAIEVRNTRNVVLYHMIFATNHFAGRKIMKAVLNRAKSELPAMVKEEKISRMPPKAAGLTLFNAEPDGTPDDLPTDWALVVDTPPQAFDPSRFPAIQQHEARDTEVQDTLF